MVFYSQTAKLFPMPWLVRRVRLNYGIGRILKICLSYISCGSGWIWRLLVGMVWICFIRHMGSSYITGGRGGIWTLLVCWCRLDFFHETRGNSFITGGRGGIWSLLADDVWIGFMSHKTNSKHHSIMRRGEAPSLLVAEVASGDCLLAMFAFVKLWGEEGAPSVLLAGVGSGSLLVGDVWIGFKRWGGGSFITSGRGGTWSLLVGSIWLCFTGQVRAPTLEWQVFRFLAGQIQRFSAIVNFHCFLGFYAMFLFCVCVCVCVECSF